jgi:hypothetical protein
MTSTVADIARLVTLVRLRYGMVESVRACVGLTGEKRVFVGVH